MKQARLCWNDDVSKLKRERSTGGAWAQATPGLLEYFEVMIQAGNSVFGPGTHWCETREAPELAPHPEVAVRQLIDDSLQAWADGDMKQHVSYFTSSAVFVTPAGECLRGHSALLHAFEMERAAMPALQMIPASVLISHPAPDTAIVLMKGSVIHSGLPEPEPFTSTQFVVKLPEGDWKIASLQVYHPR